MLHLKKIQYRANIFQIGLSTLILAVVGLFIYSWWVESTEPRVGIIRLSNPQLIGSSTLCPGDVLTYEYTLIIQGSGILDQDITIWKDEPPYTVVQAMSQRVVSLEDVASPVREIWKLPEEFHDPHTGIVQALPAGAYRINIGLSSRAQRITSSMVSVPFLVGECSDEP